MVTRKKTSENIEEERSDHIDSIIDRVGDDFSKVDDRETSLLTQESQEVLERSVEVMELVKSGKKSKEWAESQEKYIRTGIRNRQSPPKKENQKKGAKLPNTRGEGSVSSVTSEKPTKPQQKATGEVKKIDEKGKMGKRGKLGKKGGVIPTEKMPQENPSPETAEETGKTSKKENSHSSEIFEMVDSLALTLGKKKAFSKMDPMHARFAAFMALPESCESLTNTDFVNHYKIGKNGPSLWKAREDVIRARDYLIYEVARKYTPLVIKNLANSAQRKNWNTGMADAGIIKLFLQVVEKWSEKTEVEHSGQVDSVFTMDLGPSQFVKKEKLPKKEEDEDDDPPETPAS